MLARDGDTWRVAKLYERSGLMRIERTIPTNDGTPNDLWVIPAEVVLLDARPVQSIAIEEWAPRKLRMQPALA